MRSFCRENICFRSRSVCTVRYCLKQTAAQFSDNQKAAYHTQRRLGSWACSVERWPSTTRKTSKRCQRDKMEEIEASPMPPTLEICRSSSTAADLRCSEYSGQGSWHRFVLTEPRQLGPIASSYECKPPQEEPRERMDKSQMCRHRCMMCSSALPLCIVNMCRLPGSRLPMLSSYRQ